jgi:hypothetical protein
VTLIGLDASMATVGFAAHAARSVLATGLVRQDHDASCRRAIVDVEPAERARCDADTPRASKYGTGDSSSDPIRAVTAGTIGLQ